MRELPDGSLTRLTLDPGNDARPKWSADGRDIWFQTQRGGRDDDYALFRRRADGDSTEVPLLTTQYDEYSPSLSPDGRWLAYVSSPGGGQGSTGRRMMVAKLDTETGFSARSREDLFALPEGVLGGASWEPVIDVSSDGERFVMLRALSADEVTRSYQLVIVENFQAELRGRAGN